MLGKATRVLANDESINLYRRSIFNYATKDIKTQMVTDFNKMTGVDVQLSSAIISYPAIEIIPMAIYV